MLIMSVFLRVPPDQVEVLRPHMQTVIAASRAEPGCLLARMSGSGPTCFGIFADDASAEAAARRIAEKKRKYWVRSTLFRGMPDVPND